MLDLIKHTLIDSLKLLPFLFIVYFIMEFIEHKSNKKTGKLIKKSGKFGPLIGSLLGAFPQCGFSVMASNLYIGRIISLGTLIAIFLSTSDEMLPVMISNGTSYDVIIKILLVKVGIGIFFGFLIDLIFKSKKFVVKKEIEDICKDEHCHCDENIVVSSIKHAVSIFIFIFCINLILNIIIHTIGEEHLSSLFVKNKFVGPIISSFVGLIPNCASSVVITELFIKGTLNFGSVMAGLLASSGMGLLILFKVNKNLKENFSILFITYSISVIVGILINIFNFTI